MKYNNKIKILFLCTGNSCRSQMAEGWTRALKNDSIEAYSAGIQQHGLNPNAIKVMMEKGVDISHQKSQHINDFNHIKFDYIITVCGHARENCPVVFLDCKNKHVGFEDPPKLAAELAHKGASSEEQLEPYRSVRDQIYKFIETLPDSLGQISFDADCSSCSECL